MKLGLLLRNAGAGATAYLAQGGRTELTIVDFVSPFGLLSVTLYWFSIR